MMFKIAVFLTCMLQMTIPDLFAQDTANTNIQKRNKMKIEIWSDIACPFCYIGKAHLAEAMKNLPDSDQIEIEWKSFQLDPTLPKSTDKTLFASLAESKGITMEQATNMTVQVKGMAQKAGLVMDFDRVVPVNTFDAHRLLQFAKTQGKGDAVKLALLKAYFTEGADVADAETLIGLGLKAGLPEKDLRETVNGDAFAKEVQSDIAEARQFNISGVPFFVVDRKYGISGAQPAAQMEATLEKALTEWKVANPKVALEMTEGAACKPDGACD
jgi:protein disulfide-isomerase